MQYAPAFARDSADDALGGLIGAIAKKNPVALSDLHALTAARLYSLANRMLGCKEDAEEVVGDVLMYVWNHAHQYDGERGCVLAWLTVITNTRAIDRLRKRVQHPFSHESSQALLTLAADSAGPEDVVLKAQADGLLLREMARLPPLRQRLLRLSFFQEHTHTEIAHALCIPCGTVKSHVRRALMTMRTSMTSTHARRPSLVSNRPVAALSRAQRAPARLSAAAMDDRSAPIAACSGVVPLESARLGSAPTASSASTACC